jgi:uncharacterized protein YunC (DUF1805 family)
MREELDRLPRLGRAQQFPLIAVEKGFADCGVIVIATLEPSE